MEQELLFKYFRGETTQQEEKQILDWVEKVPITGKSFRMPMSYSQAWRFMLRCGANVCERTGYSAGSPAMPCNSQLRLHW